MNPSLDADLPVDRWAVRLDEPAAPSTKPAADLADADHLAFTFTLDVPAADFQPRLSRFDEAA
jgi:hypothetical protein